MSLFSERKQKVAKNILNYITNLVDKATYKGIKVLLYPCCVISITDVSADCDTDETTFTLSPIIPSFASLGGFAKIFTDGGTPGNINYVGEGVISADGKTIVLSSVPAPGADQIFTIFIFLPTNLGNTVTGVYQTAISAEVTITACV